MLIHHLSLTNFRNYARLELDLPAGPVLLLGDNAQGKTSLLEAIYYLATSRSPHAASPRQLINWLAGRESLTPAARIVAQVTHGAATHTLDVTLMLEPTATGEERFRKQIKLDSIPRRVQDLVGQMAGRRELERRLEGVKKPVKIAVLDMKGPVSLVRVSGPPHSQRTPS